MRLPAPLPLVWDAGYPYNSRVFSPRDFEWDEAKAAANLRKHGVSFE